MALLDAQGDKVRLFVTEDLVATVLGSSLGSESSESNSNEEFAAGPHSANKFQLPTLIRNQQLHLRLPSPYNLLPVVDMVVSSPKLLPEMRHIYLDLLPRPLLHGSHEEDESLDVLQDSQL